MAEADLNTGPKASPPWDNRHLGAEIVYFSRFKPSVERGGGARRMLQMQAALQTLYPDLRTVSSARNDGIPKEIRKRKIKEASPLARAFVKQVMLFKWAAGHRDIIHALHKKSAIWARYLPDLHLTRLAFLDDPVYFKPLLLRLVALGIPVIGLCQNLESLATGQVKDRYRTAMLLEEISLLRRCRAVITISREEDILMRNLGVNSFYFPYHPVAEIESQLQEIRRRRQGSVKSGILMIGGMKNKPTREGMLLAVESWHRQKLAARFGPLLVAGHDIESHFDPRPYAGSITFLGSLKAGDYADTLSRIQAMLCHQHTGAGSLTRIAEMRIAGVPVLANPHAARSFYNLPGVIEYPALAALPRILEHLDDRIAEIPPEQTPSAPPLDDLSAAIGEIGP